MEMGSASANSNTTSPPPPPESESVDGLKFGKKIYFEDVGTGAPGKSGAGSSSEPGRKVQGGQQQPPRCQVEGCKVDLSDAKAYYSRHKVCGMHSKSPKVVVNGLEQRFCQQCSRFHQLPEFDQGKRSCRRRLAGHNERRRKPPPGSGLSSRYGRLCSTMSVMTDSGRGRFLVDFSAYPRNAARDAWPRSYSADRLPGNHTTGSGRSTPNPWQNNSQNPPTNLYLQESSSGTGFPSLGIPPGECFTGVGVSDSSCALSLLSNQQWGSRNRASGLGMNDLVNAGGAPTVQSTAPHGAAVNPYPNSPWGLKSNEASGSSHEMRPDLGLRQISQPHNVQFSGELELSHQQRRQYMELEQPRGYDSSTTHINWSL